MSNPRLNFASLLARATPVDPDSADWPEVSSGITPGKLADVEQLHRLFPAVVSKWLNDHFNGDKELIAVFFNTDERTARNWLAGLNCPSGPRAVAMVIQFPDLRQRLVAAMKRKAA